MEGSRSDQRGVLNAAVKAPEAQLPGLEGVSIISQLRTRPPNEKSCAAPQPWLRAGQGLCTKHPSTFGLSRMTTKPVTRRSKPTLSVNLQGSELHDWHGSRMCSTGPLSMGVLELVGMPGHFGNGFATGRRSLELFKSHRPAQMP